MKRVFRFLGFLVSCMMLSLTAAAQTTEQKEVYTGTIFSMSGRSASVGFTLTLTQRTTDQEAQNYLSILAEQGQDDLLKVLRKNKLGTLAATGRIGRDLLVVRDTQVNGQRRIFVVFERWIRMFEVRGGYRSQDYPFAIMEIFFDEKGRGTGTFIGAAKVKIVRDKKTQQFQLEIEDFGTFPAKVMGVKRRDK